MAQLTTTKEPSFMALSTVPVPSTLPTAIPSVETISGIVIETGTPSGIAQLTLSSMTAGRPSTAAPTSSSSSSPSHTSSTVLSSGVVIGIATGAAFLAFLVVLFVVFYTRRRHSMQRRQQTHQSTLGSEAAAAAGRGEKRHHDNIHTRQNSTTHLTEMALKPDTPLQPPSFLHTNANTILRPSHEPFNFNLPVSSATAMTISPPTAYKHISKALPRPPTPTPSTLEPLTHPLPAYHHPHHNTGTRMYDDDDEHGEKETAPPYDESIYSEVRASDVSGLTWVVEERPV